MKIELCEDNGMLNDGVPTLVVLVVDGRHRIPYEATKTIQELYQDASKLVDNPIVLSTKDITLPLITDPALMGEAVWINPKSKEIERNDIVTCIEIIKDVDGNEPEGRDLELGKEYRIMDIYKQDGKVTYYDVLDDAKDNKIRIPCFPKEIRLFKKHVKKTNPVKTNYFQHEFKCDCGEKTVLTKEAGESFYTGKCEKCGVDMKKELLANV